MIKKSKTWTVEMKISGSFQVSVKADTQEEAEEAAWALFHAGKSKPENTLAWEATDAVAQLDR